jgi:hypothetical protein
MEFSKQVNELFLKGGKIIHRETYTTKTYLVRMPKGSFIQDDRTGMESNFFEYVVIGDLSNDKNIVIESSHNNNLRGAKKIMNESHTEKCRRIWRKENK